VFILLRHAQALDKRTWDRPDVERPLSRVGESQAQALVAELSPWLVTRLVSSPSIRCRQTVEPLAVARQLRVEVDDRLARDGDAAELDAWIGELADEDVLFCTHGETLAGLLFRWNTAGRLALDSPARPIQKSATAKSGGWILTRDGFLLRGRYLPPPAVLEPQGTL
jgi:phosphohistidine phosphatase SixA